VKAVPIDEFYSPSAERDCTKRIPAKYHAEIIAAIKSEMSPIEIYRYLVDKYEYPGSYSRLCYYLKECTRLKYTHHHGKLTDRCKRGHLWGEESTLWLFNREQGKYRRVCRICRRMLDKRRRERRKKQ